MRFLGYSGVCKFNIALGNALGGTVVVFFFLPFFFCFDNAISQTSSGGAPFITEVLIRKLRSAISKLLGPRGNTYHFPHPVTYLHWCITSLGVACLFFDIFMHARNELFYRLSVHFAQISTGTVSAVQYTCYNQSPLSF